MPRRTGFAETHSFLRDKAVCFGKHSVFRCAKRWENIGVAPQTDKLEAFFAELSREPDFDAPELQAYDAADLLLIERALEVGSASESATASFAGDVVVIGDRHGALTLGAIKALDASDLRVHQDPLLAERALAANAERFGLAGNYEQNALGESLLRGARLVLLQLPKSLAELEDISYNIARYADAEVTVLAGGRDKHMSRGMNEVLAKHFGEVSAGRGWRKARVLTARAPKPAATLGDPTYPKRAADPDLPFELYAFGATFGGATLDHGSRLLLETLRVRPPLAEPTRVVDIGCGNGVLAVAAALKFSDARVIASDQSAAAVASTQLTAEAAGVADRVEAHRADASEAVPAAWADLVLLNPPFHTGSTVHAGVGQRLIRSTAEALAPGGELRLVFNSHLPYRALIEREIGPTRQIARDRTFTVLAATKR